MAVCGGHVAVQDRRKYLTLLDCGGVEPSSQNEAHAASNCARRYPFADFVPSHRPGGQSVFDRIPNGRNKRPRSPSVNIRGVPVPSRPAQSAHRLSGRPASAGSNSLLVRRRSLPNASNTVRISVNSVMYGFSYCRSETKGHSGGARGFGISESKIVGDGD